MGNACQKTSVEIGDTKVGVGVASAEIKGCKSSCCMGETEQEAEQHAQHDQENERKAAQLHEITVALRIGRHMHEHELLKEIRRITDETGAVPDVVVIPPGGKTPAITRRTLTVRIGDRSPVKEATQEEK